MRLKQSERERLAKQGRSKHKQRALLTAHPEALRAAAHGEHRHRAAAAEPRRRAGGGAAAAKRKRRARERAAERARGGAAGAGAAKGERGAADIDLDIRELAAGGSHTQPRTLVICVYWMSMCL